MIALGRWLLTFIGLSVVLTLAVLNRDTLSFIWFPGQPSVMLPVMILILAGVGLGFIWGQAIAWLNGTALRRDLAKARAQVDDLRAALMTASPRPSGGDQAGPTTEEILALLPPKKSWWRRWTIDRSGDNVE